jgi:hypothetical protein
MGERGSFSSMESAPYASLALSMMMTTRAGRQKPNNKAERTKKAAKKERISLRKKLFCRSAKLEFSFR